MNTNKRSSAAAYLPTWDGKELAKLGGSRVIPSYNEQCAREVLRIFGSKSITRDVYDELRLRQGGNVWNSGRAWLSVVSEQLTILPVLLVATVPAEPVRVAEACNRGECAIRETFFGNKSLYLKSDKLVALFINTQDFGNVVIHELMYLAPAARPELVRITIPWDVKNPNDPRVLTIEPRAQFIRIMKAYCVRHG